MINMLEGGPITDTTRLHLDRCLACRACEVVCPSGVPYGHLIEAARTVIADEARPRRGWISGRLRRLALDVLADPRSLARAAAVLGLYERLGIRTLVHALGLTRALPRRLRRLEALYPPFGRPRYRAPATPPAPRARAALLLGCVMRVAYGDVHTAAGRILARQGIAVIDAPAQTCCGALHAHAGERFLVVKTAKGFTYVSPSSNLVSSVTSDAGITFSYAYDGQGRLIHVTKPDTTTK